MRTTLTLDDDVAIRLERIRKERDLDWKETVNEVLRRGLAKMDAPERRETFRVRTLDVGKPLHPVDSIADALAFGEGEDHK